MTDQRNTLPPSMRDRVSFLLYASAATAHAMADDAVRDLGLSARGVGILTLILEREPMTQRALGSLLRIDRSTMVKLLDGLEAKGFVERRRHPTDRRALLVFPTRAAEAAKARALKLLDECERRYLAPLSAADRDELGRLLARLFFQGGDE